MRNMKKLSLFVVFSLLLVFVMAGCAEKPTEVVEEAAVTAEPTEEAVVEETVEEVAEETGRLAEIKEAGELVLATGNYRPFEYHDEETNEMVGYDIDLMRLMADELGVELVVNDMDFTSLIPTLQSGKADIVCAAMYIKPEREEVVDFATPYMSTGMVLVVPEANETITSIEDVEGLKVGAKLGATSEKVLLDMVEEGMDIEIVTYNETVDYMLDLETGRIDAAVNDLLNQLEYNKEKPGLKIVGDPFTSAELGIAVQDGDAELLAFVNEMLEKLSTDGTMDTLYDQWIVGE